MLVESYLESLKWDGVDHIGLFSAHCMASSSDPKGALLKSWMVNAAGKAIMLLPNKSLCFIGESRIGKSALAAWLSTSPFYFTDGDVTRLGVSGYLDLGQKLIWEVKKPPSSLSVELLQNTQIINYPRPFEGKTYEVPIRASFIITSQSPPKFDDLNSTNYLEAIHFDSIGKYRGIVNPESMWAQAVAEWRSGYGVKQGVPA